MPIDDEERIEDLEDREDHGGECDDGDDDDSNLVEVIFKGNRRVVYQNGRNVAVSPGAYVIVEADKGEDIGRVGQLGDELRTRRKSKGKRKAVTRIANEDELRRWRNLRLREEEAYFDFSRRVARRRMPMKPVDVEYQLDGKKVCFYFTADHRVDFRELVRELAGVYRTRIELRQIGVRDEAKRLGGIGSCGRELCCSTFLREFAPITSQMARDQNLSLNPSKLSGVCGRLKCCLRFEHDFYHEAQGKYPKFGTKFIAGEREGRVNKVDFFRDEITVRFDDGDERTLSLAVLDGSAPDRTAPRRKPHLELELAR